MFTRPKKRYYATRQLYHFVRPGYQRVAAQPDAPGLTVSAFRDPRTGSLIVVGVKERGPDQLRVMPPEDASGRRGWELYVTSRSANCLKTDEIAENAGTVQITLPEEAVFTLVGNRE